MSVLGSRGLARALEWAKRRFAHGSSAAPRRVMRTSLGVVSYFEDDGPSGIPVVLFRREEIDPLFEALRGTRPVVAVDLPNHGRSERLARPPSRDDLARAAIEVIADVGVRYGASPDVVAAGASGELLARALARAPHLARSLAVLAEAAAGSRMRRLAAWRHVDASAYAALALPLCFLHGGTGGARGDLSPLARELDAVVASRPATRRVSLGEKASDPYAVADALAAFWASLAARPRLRVVRGGRTGPRARRGERGARPYPHAVKRGHP